MRYIMILAFSAFRESIRDKVLYNLGLFAVAMILFGLILGDWAVFARETVIKDFTFGVMSISGLFISIFIGIGLVQKEIQRRTVLTLLAKPVTRWQFIFGKYLGLVLVIAVNIIMMTFVFYFVLWLTDSAPAWKYLQAVYLIFLEMCVVVAVAVLFSTFSTPIMSSVLTLGVYIAGHLSGDMMKKLKFSSEHAALGFGEEIPAWLGYVIQGIYYGIPNLEHFNIKGRIVYGQNVSFEYIGWMSLYGFFWIGLLLSIGCWWFSRRDFV